MTNVCAYGVDISLISVQVSLTTTDTDKRPRFFRVCLFVKLPDISDKCNAPSTIVQICQTYLSPPISSLTGMGTH